LISCIAEVLTPLFFSPLEPSLISLHSYPSQWIWVKWYWTWFQGKKRGGGGNKNLHVLTPTKTYSKTLVPSTVIPIPIHVDCPSTSFQMSAIQPSPSVLVCDHSHHGYQRILVRTNQEQLIDINCTLWLFGYHFKNRS
jgi:hypothetical protein